VGRDEVGRVTIVVQLRFTAGAMAATAAQTRQAADRVNAATDGVSAGV
jgi:hypothetical protein